MFLRSLLFFQLITVSAFAHPDHKEADGSQHTHSRAAGVAFGVSEAPEGFVLPQKNGPRPWSTKPVLNDPDRFQIAIVTDRTGGHRPGVWLEAMQKLNRLRPQFVMSVGDLIEGYTENRRRLEREWAEFLGLLDTLDMKFFFVPGNHDVINPVQHEMWRAKFGDEWYSFDYRDVHFICLNSEDTRNQIGEEQLAWLREDLSKHKEARWTLVFVHKPLWSYSERAQVSGNPDTTNWPNVEELLADRPHTVFSGHVHNYTQYTRNGGRHYYSMATTGGSSRLRGDKYGEFDHVMWLTMESDGPHLAVVKLDGVASPDIVTSESAERFRKFLELARIEVAPILLDNDAGFGEGEIHVRLVNDFGEHLTASGQIDGLPLRGLTVDPAELSLAIGPTGVAEHSVAVRFAEPVDLDKLAATTLTATISTGGDNPLRAERIVPVVIDRRHTCPKVESPPVIDGIAEPWPTLTYQPPASPRLLGSRRYWQGPADGSFTFHTSHDDESIYLAARVTDERLTSGDRLEFLFDGRRMERRRESPRMRWGTCRVSGWAPVEGAETNSAAWSGRRRTPVDGAQVAVAPTEDGYAVEVRLPKEVINSRQGNDWHSFQLAVVLHDVDEEGGEATRILWRGTEDVFRSNRRYGHFVRTTGTNKGKQAAAK